MGDAVVGHGVDHGVAEDDLTVVVGGGVVVEHGFHVGIEQAFHFGQAVDEHQGEVGSTLWRQPLVGVAVEEQSACNLLLKQRVERLHVYTYIILSYLFLRLPLVEVVGEDDGLSEADDVLHSVDGGQRRVASRHETVFLHRVA